MSFKMGWIFKPWANTELLSLSCFCLALLRMEIRNHYDKWIKPNSERQFRPFFLLSSSPSLLHDFRSWNWKAEHKRRRWDLDRGGANNAIYGTLNGRGGCLRGWEVEGKEEWHARRTQAGIGEGHGWRLGNRTNYNDSYVWNLLLKNPLIGMLNELKYANKPMILAYRFYFSLSFFLVQSGTQLRNKHIKKIVCMENYLK